MKKSLHIVFAFLAVLPALAQETPVNNGTFNNSTPLNTNNSIQLNYTPVEEENEEIPVADTVTVLDELDKEEAKPLKKSKITRSVQSAPVKASEAPAAPVMESESAAGSANVGLEDEPTSSMDLDVSGEAGAMSTYQQASYNFSISKDQAAQQRTQRTPSLRQQLEMDEAVGYFEANAPNSFEYNYYKYVSGNYDVSLVGNLREAEKLRPNNVDVQVQMAGYNMIMQQTDSANMYVDELVASGRLSSNTLYYAEDLLLSVPENGVLITHGFDDTYGVWKKKEGDQVRPDVTLISLDFLQSAHYRALLKEQGFKLPDSEVINVDYFSSFCALNKDKNLSVSMTTPKEYLAPVQSKLYVTGLVFEYHEGDFNNFERNDALWNSTLKKHLIDNATDDKAKQLSSNYLPMLLQLRKVYGQKGEETKLRDVDKAADKVGLQCKKYEQVQQLKKSY